MDTHINRVSRAGWSIHATVVLVCAVAILGALWYAASRPWSGITTVTPGECLAEGGEIVDTFGQDAPYANERFLGEVEGLKCSCVCVRRMEMGNE